MKVSHCQRAVTSLLSVSVPLFRVSGAGPPSECVSEFSHLTPFPVTDTLTGQQYVAGVRWWRMTSADITFINTILKVCWEMILLYIYPPILPQVIIVQLSKNILKLSCISEAINIEFNWMLLVLTGFFSTRDKWTIN